MQNGLETNQSMAQNSVLKDQASTIVISLNGETKLFVNGWSGRHYLVRRLELLNADENILANEMAGLHFEIAKCDLDSLITRSNALHHDQQDHKEYFDHFATRFEAYYVGEGKKIDDVNDIDVSEFTDELTVINGIERVAGSNIQFGVNSRCIWVEAVMQPEDTSRGFNSISFNIYDREQGGILNNVLSSVS